METVGVPCNGRYVCGNIVQVSVQLADADENPQVSCPDCVEMEKFEEEVLLADEEDAAARRAHR